MSGYRSAAGLAQSGGRIAAYSRERRNEPEGDCRADGEQESESDDAEIEDDRAAGEREYQALGEQLAGNSPASGADRGAHCDLTAARGMSGKQQVRDIRTRNCEQQKHCAEQDEERLLDA